MSLHPVLWLEQQEVHSEHTHTHRGKIKFTLSIIKSVILINYNTLKQVTGGFARNSGSPVMMSLLCDASSSGSWFRVSAAARIDTLMMSLHCDVKE